jgi:putative SOS response-associated peptidase YedK
MCGRFVSSSPPDRVAAFFGAPAPTGDSFEPNFNVAPTTPILGLAPEGRDGERSEHDHPGAPGAVELQRYRWGLVPSWAKDTKIGSSLINARAETVRSKPAFRSSFAKRRIIVPMDGFYEWRTEPAAGGVKPVKQPMFISARDHRLLAVAGLAAVWRDPTTPDAAPVWSCTLITTEANATMAQVHDRMPVFLPRDDWTAWLDPSTPLDDVESLLVAAPEELLEMYPVSTEVNNVRNKGAHLAAPVG